ncbi:MAG: hypothetical protein IKL04_00765 [Lachnospiraceae bacterium]|nr:hypothetical protein [Lachnospiraceae bacterium]
MFWYQVYGLKVMSDLMFPQLMTAESEGEADLIIRSTELSKDIQDKWPTVKYEFGQEYSWLSNKTCQLQVHGGREISYALTGAGMPQYLQTYILGYGMSMAALQRGKLCMHCSAMADDKGAIMIAGESGAGKSTVTTFFLATGYRLMADDMAFVDENFVYPAFPYQKLCRDVVEREGYDINELIYIDEDKDKFLAPVKDRFEPENRPVKGFVYLYTHSGQDVIVEEFTGLQRFYVFAGNLFLRKFLKNQKFAPYIGDICLKMAAKVPVLAIGRPNGSDTAAEVVARAMEWAEKL